MPRVPGAEESTAGWNDRRKFGREPYGGEEARGDPHSSRNGRGHSVKSCSCAGGWTLAGAILRGDPAPGVQPRRSPPHRTACRRDAGPLRDCTAGHARPLVVFCRKPAGITVRRRGEALTHPPPPIPLLHSGSVFQRKGDKVRERTGRGLLVQAPFQPYRHAAPTHTPAGGTPKCADTSVPSGLEI